MFIEMQKAIAWINNRGRLERNQFQVTLNNSSADLPSIKEIHIPLCLRISFPFFQQYARCARARHRIYEAGRRVHEWKYGEAKAVIQH